MARPTEIEHDIVGNIDQRRNRPLSDGFQATLHPVRRRTVGDPANDAAIESGAAFGIVGSYIYRSP